MSTLAAKNIELLTSAFQTLAKAFSNAPKSAAAMAGILDNITKSHTGFYDFSELLDAKGGYFPSLQKAPQGNYHQWEIVTMACGRQITREVYYAELDLLALAYDMAQLAKGDSRRAFRS